MPKITIDDLPDRPSALIRLALEDLARVEDDDRYAVDMTEWHTPRGDGKCHVCFAGAVMKGVHGPDRFLHDGDFTEETRNKLIALNYFRMGFIETGIEAMDGDVQKLPRGMAHMRIVPYSWDRAAFRTSMEEMVAKLEETGL
jgi:hypothetical protein